MCYKTQGIDSMPRQGLESVNCSLIAIPVLENETPVTVNPLIRGESTPLIRCGDTVQVYANRCPHQGRRLDYAPDRFLIKDATLVCAAHGAVFGMADGLCLQGPCRGESLMPYACQWQDGVLRIEWPAQD
jgi:nitrite reductase/ring-hydroxylating ferredoxin subunit